MSEDIDDKVESLTTLDEEKARRTAEFVKQELVDKLGVVSAKLTMFEAIATLGRAESDLAASGARIDQIHKQIHGEKPDE